MKEESSKDEINEMKETEETVSENFSENKDISNNMEYNLEDNKKNIPEPKRIKIPLIVLILFLMILITGIVAGAIIILKHYIQF